MTRPKSNKPRDPKAAGVQYRNIAVERRRQSSAFLAFSALAFFASRHLASSSVR